METLFNKLEKSIIKSPQFLEKLKLKIGEFKIINMEDTNFLKIFTAIWVLVFAGMFYMLLEIKEDVGSVALICDRQSEIYRNIANK